MVQQMRKWASHRLARVPLAHLLGTKMRFRVERELINGSHHNENTHRSIIHFSVNKAATRYTQGILSRCAKEQGLTHARIHDYAFCSDFPYLDHLSALQMIQYQHIFKPRGYLYSVFGGMIEGIPNLDDYHIVLIIRDPRDVVTSSYFSMAYSHLLPQGRNRIKSFTKKRSFAQQAGIDEYVISESDSVCRVYQRYLDLLVQSRPNVYFAKYEDMIADFPTWLERLLESCELKVSPRLRQDLLQEAVRAQPKKENISKHVRQVTPGDHTRKLQRATVDHLNRLFADVLTDLNYA